MRGKLGLVLLLLVLPALGGAGKSVGCSCTTARVTEVELARGYDDGKLVGATTSFQPSDTIFAVVRTQNVPSGTKVAAEWWVVEAATGEKDQKISNAELVIDESRDAVFTLAPTGAWPSGKYKVIISIDGKPQRTTEFAVASM